jgi:hypothetical protein
LGRKQSAVQARFGHVARPAGGYLGVAVASAASATLATAVFIS